MSDFELVFKGALSRYLRSQGYDVDRIEEYYGDRDENSVLVWFRDSEGNKILVDLGPLELLMEQL